MGEGYFPTQKVIDIYQQKQQTSITSGEIWTRKTSQSLSSFEKCPYLIVLNKTLLSLPLG